MTATSSRTTYLARLFGLSLTAIALAMLSHKHETVATATALMHDPPVLFFASAASLIAGLAIVLGHNVWSGGALPILVTLVGWGASIKSLILLFLMPEASARYFASLHYEQLFYFYAAIALTLGLCLTYGGFRTAWHPVAIYKLQETQV